MKDYITLSKIAGLRAELVSKGMVCDDGSPHLAVTKTPTIRDGIHTIALVRCADQEADDLIHSITTIEIIGECVNNTYTFYSQDAQTKYEQLMEVGAYNVPINWVDDDGVASTYNKPYMFGVFA